MLVLVHGAHIDLVRTTEDVESDTTPSTTLTKRRIKASGNRSAIRFVFGQTSSGRAQGFPHGQVWRANG
jgi:hypothetical protein